MINKLVKTTILGASFWKFALLFAALFMSYSFSAHAQEDGETPADATPVADAPAEEPEAGPVDDYLGLVEAQGEYAPAYDFFTTSMLWTVIAAALVFLMHLGFATLESGLCQQKNVVNVLFKNVFIVSIGIISYAVIGFNTHYPGFGDGEGWLKFGGMIGDLNADGGGTWGYGGLGLAMTGFGDFIFQAMFAATGATIVSGAVAERVKLPSFMIFAALFVGLAYPIAGSWHWGEGYLSQLEVPFKDFAGSTVVHAFGGFGALACVMVLGPRKGKYTENGIKPIPAHNFPLAAIGVFLLMFGWYGFNGGSVLSAEPGALGLVFTTTTLAACAGALGAITVSWAVLKKPDLSMALNGILAGLVGITANADVVSVMDSIVIGAIAGGIVVISIILLDKVKIDDPVGAISVHGVCGIWGTIAVAIFGDGDFSMATQIQGALLVSVFAFVFAYVVFFVLKMTIGVRVSEEEEERGLDITEHGQEAYSS
jgi:Amt family ammonium transporter